MKYPFTPELLDALPEELAELFRSLELTLLEEICSRLKAADNLNEVTVEAIRALRSHGVDLKEIRRAIGEAAKVSAEKLDELFDRVVERNQEYYAEMIDLAQVTKPDRLVDESDVAAIRQQTKEELTNLTQSMGFVVTKGGKKVLLAPAKAYQWALDNAEARVMSGVISYNEAIRRAVQELAESGIRRVDYESGHTDHADVAVRRAVMTGVNQTCQRYSEQSVDYLETDLVEVSAHIGARDTGSGPENHKAWQGKVYRWEGKRGRSKGSYPGFIATTGYGTGPGLGGWNCRHTFTSFVENVMEPTYTAKELKEIDDSHGCEFEGRRYSAYEATQKQREIERTIRALKRKKTAFEAAGLKQEAQNASIRMRRLNAEYKAFSEAAGLKQQRERMKVWS